MAAYAIAMLIIAIASTAVQYKTAENQADANKDFLEKQHKITTDNLEDEANDAASIASKKAMKQRAMIHAATGEMGLGGATADQYIDDSLFAEQEEVERINYKRRKELERAKTQAEGGTQYGGNKIAAGLQIGGAIANYGATSKNAQTDEKI